MQKEIFIPAGRGRNSEVYVDGVPYMAEYINLNNISRLKSTDGKTLNLKGDELRAIIAKDERNHQYYKDNPSCLQKPPLPKPLNTETHQPQGQAEPQPIAQPEKSPKLTTINYNTLMQQQYPPLHFQISEILPEGIFILAGAPKIGKSWLVLDMCFSIATGGSLWDYDTTKGGVLYIALEDNNRRLQDRLVRIVDKTCELQQNTINLHFATSSKGLFDGLSQQIDEFMAEYPDTRLIAIDTLEHIRRGGQEAATRHDRGLYSADYNDMQILRAIADKYDGLTLLLIHHTRKLYDADPLFTVTGSTGLTGAVDGIWVLDKDKRTENSATLTISNRDTKGYAFKLKLDEDICKWQFISNVQEDEQDDRDRLAGAINGLFIRTDVTDTTEWKGNATALCTALHKIDDRLTIRRRKHHFGICTL